MDLYDKIRKSLAIEIVNPKTGNVEWIFQKEDKKFTHTRLITVLTEHLGWTYGDSLLLRKEGDFFEVMDGDHYHLAIIGKKLAASFRNVPFAKFTY